MTDESILRCAEYFLQIIQYSDMSNPYSDSNKLLTDAYDNFAYRWRVTNASRQTDVWNNNFVKAHHF